MTKRIAIALAVSLVACGGVPFETVPLVVGPDAGDDAPSASSSSSSSSGGGSSSSSSGSVAPPDAGADVVDPPAPDAAPVLEAEAGPAPPVDACAPVMHTNGVAACVRESFVDCTSGVNAATANDACGACTGGASGCNRDDVCPDPTGTVPSSIACAYIPTAGGTALEACWAYTGPLAGHACSVAASAGDCCPTLDDPRWY